MVRVVQAALVQIACIHNKGTFLNILRKFGLLKKVFPTPFIYAAFCVIIVCNNSVLIYAKLPGFMNRTFVLPNTVAKVKNNIEFLGNLPHQFNLLQC